MRRDVFVSYSRHNYKIVDEIRKQIDDATGAECWLNLKGGIAMDSRDFEDSIIEGIMKCSILYRIPRVQNCTKRNRLRH